MRAKSALTLCFAVPLVGAAAGGTADATAGETSRVDFRIAPVRHVHFTEVPEKDCHETGWQRLETIIEEPALSFLLGLPLAPRFEKAAGPELLALESDVEADVGGPLSDLDGDIRAHPLAFSVGITGFKAGLADLLVQLYSREPTQEPVRVNHHRLATFVLTGAVYQGLFQYWLFNVVIERMLPGHTLRATLQKVLAANLLCDPIFFFPFFYLLHECMARSRGQVFQMDTVSTAFGKYYANCLVDWRNSWSIWLPGHAVTYGVMPPHLRMPWVAAVSFGYIALLSMTRGSGPTPTPSK